jgi:cyclohexanone monooxygenase
VKRAPRPEIRNTTPDERRAAFDKRGFGVFQYYRDVYRDLEANELACELYRDHVHQVVEDPGVADALSPTDYPLGCKRQVLDTDYYQTFNRPDVSLVDLETDPLVTMTANGVKTESGEQAFDMIVLATGFDAMTGALDRIDIRGRNGRALKEAWAEGPRTYLGLQVAGFPNLFTVTGPGSPSVLSNMLVAIEHHVDWITECLIRLRDDEMATIEPTIEAQDDWVDHVNEVAEDTMYTAPNCASWYLGSNIDGKARVFMPYVGGLGRYRQRCAEVVAGGYEGFVLSPR